MSSIVFNPAAQNAYYVPVAAANVAWANSVAGYNQAEIASVGGAKVTWSSDTSDAIDALVAALVRRRRRGDGSGRELRAFRRGSWREFPSENWLVLPRYKWQKLTPPQDARTGDRWALDRQLSAELLTYFYPQTENNDIASNRLDEQLLEASVVATDADQIRLRLIGHLRMKHAFYPNRDENIFVEATLAGYVDVVPGSREIRAFKLVTNVARYGDEQFGAVLEMAAKP